MGNLREKLNEFHKRRNRLRNTHADAPILEFKKQRLLTDIISYILPLQAQERAYRIKPFLMLIDQINIEFRGPAS